MRADFSRRPAFGRQKGAEAAKKRQPESPRRPAFGRQKESKTAKKSGSRNPKEPAAVLDFGYQAAGVTGGIS